MLQGCLDGTCKKFNIKILNDSPAKTLMLHLIFADWVISTELKF